MLSTVNSVREYTGYDVTQELINRAQALVEIYVGKDEIDIQLPSDLLLLDKMVAYQSAYMLENEDIVFKQIAASTYDSKMSAPFIAPLAVIASNGLSFNKTRSYKTGRIFQRGPLSWRDWTRY